MASDKVGAPTPTSSGLPRLKGPDHIGLTVPNLDEAVVFFKRILGFEVLYPLGPLKFDNDWF